VALIRFKRGSTGQLDVAAANGELTAGEPYALSDGTFALGLSATTYALFTPGGEAVAPSYEKRYDDAGGGVSYLGEADPGSDPSDPVWRIQRIVDSGGDLTVEFADGDALFNNVWDDRASLTY
jgi:hypothetical protein